MKYTRLGRTGLEVSQVCLGCMSFGEPQVGAHPWTLNEAQSRPILRAAWEAGINFFDTANVYSGGTSELIVGKVLAELAPREQLVVATKVHGEMRKGPNGRGLSRKAILSEIDASLTRLNMDYVDLYQIHRFDAITPIEETLHALDDVVRSGKARYIGASSMYAWQFMKMLAYSEAHDLARFVSMQNHLNLMYREEEREMLPLCADQGIGVIPWSPLARGRLARPWGGQSSRIETDAFGKNLYASETVGRAVNDAVSVIAESRNVSMAQVALAWVMQKNEVTSPIIGATKMAHLEDAVAAVDLLLTPNEVAQLEAPYQPTAVAGFS